MATSYRNMVGATSAAVGSRYPVVGAAMGVASNPTDPSNIISSLTTAVTRGTAVGTPAITPILAQTAQQVLGIKQPDGTVLLEDGTRISATQSASMGLSPSTPAGTTVVATPTVPLGTVPTTQRTTYQNVVTSPVSSMPTTAYTRSTTSAAISPTQSTNLLVSGRSPIMDGTTTVGYTDLYSDGSQKVYYVVAGYPKSGMPKPGTYRKGVAIPRARKMRYNKRKPRTTKSKKKIATSQKKMTKSWLEKKLRF